MEKKNKTIEATFELIKAGLWNHSVQLASYSPVDFSAIYQIADEQAVVGLVAAGMERVDDMRIVKQDALPFLKRVFGLENRNIAMNGFISDLTERLRKVGISFLLVKGQGIAQCYERPLWRQAGDIDLLLDDQNYLQAKVYLSRFSSSSEPEEEYKKHLSMTVNSWVVELHGTLRGGLSRCIDRGIDSVQKNTFYSGDVRAWRDGDTDVFLPGPNSDVIFVFTHLLQHFYKGGIGLRQFCDWCRLLWTYRNTIDVELLRVRLCEMRIMSEWKAFASYVAIFLGMPVEAIPLFDAADKWKRKANRIHSFVLKVGNFGQNRDLSYYANKPYLMRKVVSLMQRIGDVCRHSFIFPFGALRFLPSILYHGFQSAVKGE